MKWLGRGLLLIVALLIVVVALLWTSDTDRDAMIQKYGEGVARFTVSQTGMEVHYRVSGPEGAPVMIMIHGTAASLHTWEPLRERLEQTFKIIAYDQPGHGLTGPHPERDYTYSGMADALDAVFAAEDVEQAILVGNSMGGWVAWRDALANPERVSHLVLLDASGIPSQVKTESNLGFRLLQSSIGRALMQKLTPRAAIESSLRGSVSRQEIASEAMIDRYWELLRFPGNRQAAGDQFTSPRQNRSAEIANIAVPTLILWGDEDKLIPVQNAALFGEKISGSKVIVYTGIGHLPMEETPDEVASDIRDFLQSRADM